LSKTIKIVLGIIAFVVVVSICLVVTGVLWFRSHSDQLRSDGEKAMREGEQFGGSHTQAECIAEASTRNASCGAVGFVCEAGANLFLDKCLAQSPAEPATCDGVPQMSEIILSASWGQARCKEIGRPGSQSCGRLMQALQRHCRDASPRER
jgi:hypothetical protein